MSSTSTNFLNSKKRRIFVSGSGAFFAKSEDGKRIYKPKAMFRSTGEGSMRRIAAHNAVPNAIKSKKFRMSKRKAPKTPKARSAKVAKKNIMVFSAGGTLYKSMRSMLAKKKRAAKKSALSLTPLSM